MKKLAYIVFLLFPFQTLADVKPLVADLSTYTIKIDSTFSGTDILLFGAAAEAGDLIAVVRGPDRKYIVRKKEKIGGMWVNGKQDAFNRLPGFISLASSTTTARFAESVQWVAALPVEYSIPWQGEKHPNDFAEALYNRKVSKNLVNTKPQRISFMGDSLFRVNLHFPANIPRGQYTVEVYLVSGNRILGAEFIPITVHKSGMDAFMFDLANKRPALYGAISILIAIVGGLTASRLFRRMDV